MHKILDDKKNNKFDFFLEPIPKWITHLGFATMALILIAIIVFATCYKYPRSVFLAISIYPDRAIAKTDFDTFKILTESNEVIIFLPLNDTNLKGRIVKKDAWINGSDVYFPVQLAADLEVYQIRFKDVIYCRGKVLLSSSTLLNEVFSRHQKS